MAKITNTGVHIVEGAAAAADVAGSSQLWVLQDTPSSLYHTDDAGTDHRLGITLSAEQATTSGTSIDFTGIPPGVKKLTFMFAGISTNSTSDMILQLGDSGGFETSGYTGRIDHFAATEVWSGEGADIIQDVTAADLSGGTMIMHLEDATNNTWMFMGIGDAGLTGTIVSNSAGYKSLSGVLTQLRLTTEGGSAVFDAGGAAIQFE